MHPEIQKNEPGQCPICSMNLELYSHLLKKDLFIPLNREAAVSLIQIALISSTFTRHAGTAFKKISKPRPNSNLRYDR